MSTTWPPPSASNSHYVGAIRCDEHPPLEAAHRAPSAAGVQILDNGVEQLIEVLRRHAVEQLPDRVVAGDAIQAEQGVGVGATSPSAQRARVRRERGRLHKEHRQRRPSASRWTCCAAASSQSAPDTPRKWPRNRNRHCPCGLRAVNPIATPSSPTAMLSSPAIGRARSAGAQGRADHLNHHAFTTVPRLQSRNENGCENSTWPLTTDGTSGQSFFPDVQASHPLETITVEAFHLDGMKESSVVAPCFPGALARRCSVAPRDLQARRSLPRAPPALPHRPAAAVESS